MSVCIIRLHLVPYFTALFMVENAEIPKCRKTEKIQNQKNLVEIW